jgi:hypothetical protein
MSLAEAARAALKPLFGDQIIEVECISMEDKIIQYSTDLEGALV